MSVGNIITVVLRILKLKIILFLTQIRVSNPAQENCACITSLLFVEYFW